MANRASSTGPMLDLISVWLSDAAHPIINEKYALFLKKDTSFWQFFFGNDRFKCALLG